MVNLFSYGAGYVGSTCDSCGGNHVVYGAQNYICNNGPTPGVEVQTQFVPGPPDDATQTQITTGGTC